MLILPASLGLTDTINAGLARVFFSWTLHAIVYFWLMPTYIAFYTIVPRAIGGRLYSDTMGRVAFVLFLVFSMPIGIHHLFADPQVGAGFKFVHAVMTAMVSVPTLLTVFTIVASVEIAGRLRGGKGAFGWVKALPWDNPAMLAVTFSFVMLGLGRCRRHHQHELPAQRDGAQHAVGHRALPPDLRRRDRHHVFPDRLRAVAAAHRVRDRCRSGSSTCSCGCGSSACSCCRCPGTWWACSGCRGAWRTTTSRIRTLQPQAWTVTASTLGGLLLVISAVLLVFILATAARRAREPAPFTFSETVHAGGHTPRCSTASRLWVAMMIALTLVNYGFPIAQLAVLEDASVPVIPIGSRW